MSCEKVFNDAIHGSILVPPYCQLIIDTPEFQRLRYIKQLGATCYVYPTAVHTRFDHCIGVSHLAGKLAETLKNNGSCDIMQNEVACVEIAGLCHDLGHGPFSHAFEDIVPLDEVTKKPWKHETQSVVLFKHLIKKRGLANQLDKYNIYPQEIELICELIFGQSLEPGKKLKRGNKYYLYQIVNNSVNGVDVDKWDYFARDTHFLGMQSAFNFNRILPFVRVYEVNRDGVCRKELCFRDKVAGDLNHMFLTRRRLHYAAYQHRVSSIIMTMIKDAIRAAAKNLIFIGQEGLEYTLLESVKDPEAFCQVNDSIIHEISRSRSQDAGMVKAREIIDRIHKRQLYPCLIEIQHADDKLNTVERDKIQDEVVKIDGRIWRAENLVIEVSPFDYGKGDQNPLLDIQFYKKSKDERNVKATLLSEEELPTDLPQQLRDVTVRIYSKLPSLSQDDIEEARHKFEETVRRSLYRRPQPPKTPGKQTGSYSRTYGMRSNSCPDSDGGIRSLNSLDEPVACVTPRPRRNLFEEEQ